MVASVVTGVGASNCSWASCRDGCVNDIYRCTQVLVHYTNDTRQLRPFLTNGPGQAQITADQADTFVDSEEDYKENDFANIRGMIDPESFSEIVFEYENAVLQPNLKGCGYPMYGTCREFDEEYSEVGYTFECYRSKLFADKALTHLNTKRVKLDLFKPSTSPCVSTVQ